MKEPIKLSDPLWDDYYPEISVFERTEVPGVYKFLFINKNDLADRIEVQCRWEELREWDRMKIISDEVQAILDEDRQHGP